MNTYSPQGEKKEKVEIRLLIDFRNWTDHSNNSTDLVAEIFLELLAFYS